MFPEGLFPSIDGLHLEALHIDPQSITAIVAVATPNAICPLCRESAMRVHSRYVRTAADLPWAGIRVRLQITVRRFFCDNATCPRRIFAERLGEALPAFARRTVRLTKALCAMAFAAGGEEGARLAHAQAMPVSPRTLLRLLESSFLPATSPPRVVGLDEWAWKKGRSYGTIFVDLERKQPVDLLSDRDANSVAVWLKKHSSVEIIVRDRSGLFADGAVRGAPKAIQVIDRYHMIKNLVEALERFFLHKRSVLKTLHEQQQHNASSRLLPLMEGIPSSAKAEAASLRRHAYYVELYEKIHQFHTKNVEVATIARHVGVSRQTVYRYLHMKQAPERTRIQYTRKKLIEPYKPYLLQRWNEGCRNAQLMRDKLRKVNPPAKQPRQFGVAPDGYNAALDLSHTALRAESEGERYTGVLHRPTLAFALRV